MIRWIFFDIGNVLFVDEPFTAMQWQALHDAILSSGQQISFEALMGRRETLVSQNQDAKPHVSLGREFLGEEGWAELQECGQRKLGEDYFAYNYVIEGAEAVLRNLSTSYKLGVAANQPKICRLALETAGLLDYFSVVKGGGHGGYRNLVLAASSVQELFDLTQLAFHLADQYRILVLLLTDGILGQIMEPIDIRPLSISGLGKLPSKEWALTGLESRGEQSILSTMLMRENQVLEWHERATDKYRRIQENEIRFDTYYWEEAWIGVVAFGMTARAVETAVDLCRENGIPVGLLRPITLFPFCSDFLHHSLSHIQQFLVVEVNLGQMVEDVRLAVGGERSVDFLGQPAGLPSPSQVVEAIERLARDNG